MEKKFRSLLFGLTVLWCLQLDALAMNDEEEKTPGLSPVILLDENKIDKNREEEKVIHRLYDNEILFMLKWENEADILTHEEMTTYQETSELYMYSKRLFKSKKLTEVNEGRMNLHNMVKKPETYFSKQYQKLISGSGCWSRYFLEPIELRVNAGITLIENGNEDEKLMASRALKAEADYAVHFVRFTEVDTCCGNIKKGRGKRSLSLIAALLAHHPVSYPVAEQCYDYGTITAKQYAQKTLKYFSEKLGDHYQFAAAKKLNNTKAIIGIARYAKHPDQFAAANWLYRNSNAALKEEGEKAIRNIATMAGCAHQNDAKRIVEDIDGCVTM